MIESLNFRWLYMRRVRQNEEAIHIPKDSILNLENYTDNFESKESLDQFLENNVFLETGQDLPYVIEKSQFYQKNFLGQLYYGILVIENTSAKTKTNMTVSFYYEKRQQKKENFAINEIKKHQLKPNQLFIVPFKIWLGNCDYKVIVKTFYYDKQYDELSDSITKTAYIYIKPQPALQTTITNKLNELSDKTECIFQLQMKNISGFDINIDNIDVQTNKGSIENLNLEFLIPQQKDILISDQETFQILVSLSKDYHPFDCMKQITFAFAKIYYSFLIKNLNSGLLQYTLVKEINHKTNFKFILEDQKNLIIKNKHVNVIDGLMLNLTNKSLYVELKDNNEDNQVLSIHKITVDPKHSVKTRTDVYKLESKSFIKAQFIIFPKQKGFFNFNFFDLVQYQSQKRIHYDSFIVKIKQILISKFLKQFKFNNLLLFNKKQ